MFGLVLGEKAHFGQFSLFFQFCTHLGPNFDDFSPKIEGKLIDSCVSFCTPAAHTTPYIPSPTLQIKRAGGGSGSAGSIRPPSGPGRARSSACIPLPYHTLPYQGGFTLPNPSQTGNSRSHRPPWESQKIRSKMYSKKRSKLIPQKTTFFRYFCGFCEFFR